VTKAALAITTVTVRFGERLALDDVTLHVRAGERVAVIGPSGAGKSTLLAVAETRCEPSSGSLSLFGEQITASTDSARRAALRRAIGVLDQTPHLPGSLRVIHNVNAGRLGEWNGRQALGALVRPRRWADEDTARQVLDRMGLADALWKRTDQLSGGERQRVALARLLVQGARLILADEPTSSLDPARAEEVLRLLSTMCSGDRALVVTLHDVGLARRHFTRIVGLRSGRCLFDVAADQLDDRQLKELYRISDGVRVVTSTTSGEQ
jgi:phosphonate transport system ATP-binding protein